MGETRGSTIAAGPLTSVSATVEGGVTAAIAVRRPNSSTTTVGGQRVRSIHGSLLLRQTLRLAGALGVAPVDIGSGAIRLKDHRRTIVRPDGHRLVRRLRGQLRHRLPPTASRSRCPCRPVRGSRARCANRRARARRRHTAAFRARPASLVRCDQSTKSGAPSRRNRRRAGTPCCRRPRRRGAPPDRRCAAPRRAAARDLRERQRGGIERRRPQRVVAREDHVSARQVTGVRPGREDARVRRFCAAGRQPAAPSRSRS